MFLVRFFKIVKNEDGASAIEFAIVLPILLLLIFGIIEFGLLYHDYLAVTHAAREGARLAAVNKYTEDTVKARTGLPTSEWPKISVSEDPSRGGNTGDPVTVTVVYPHSLLTGYLQAAIPSFPSTIPLTSKAVMRLEQPQLAP